MEAFTIHQSSYLDHDSQVGYEWWAESSPAMFQTVLHMVARSRGQQVKIEMTVSDGDRVDKGEEACVREAMILAEQALMRDLAKPEGSNTRGVLRHLVQMAKAVAA